MMSVRRAGVFIADLERQFEWYKLEAGPQVAERYLTAVEATCKLLGAYPLLGSPLGSKHPRLCGWRSFLVLRPFHRHILFYEITESDVVLRRAMHGHSELHRRLIEPEKPS